MRNIDLQTYRKFADTAPAPLRNAVSVEAEGSQYDKGFVLPSDRDPLAALNENRAQLQTWQDKLGNGLVNMAASAFAGATESTVGLVYGSLDALLHWDASKFYDNEVGRAVDAVTNAARKNNPFYYSQAEQEASALGSMGYANFWFDKVLGSSGYTIGSLATGYGMARLFNMGKTAMLGQLGEEAMAAANAGTQAVEGLSNAAGIQARWNVAKEMGLGTVMAYGESAAEARGTQNETRDKLTKLRDAELQKPIELRDAKYANLTDAQIEQYAKDAANTNFLMNMIITGPTNTLLLGKWINPGKKQAVKLFNEIGTREIAGGTVEYFDKMALKKGRAFLNAGEKFLQGFATEGGQEGLQYASNIASQEFVRLHGMNGQGWFSSLVDGLGEGLNRAVTDKEGIQSILAGGISGGPFGLKGARSERLTTDKNTQDLVNALNEDPNFLNANPYVKAFVASTKLTLEANQDLKAGDIFNAKNKTDQALNEYIKSQIEKGSLDYFITRLESLKEVGPDELAKHFGEGTTTEDIDKIIDKAQKLNELHDNITTLYGISSGTEEQRAYNAQLRERLFYSAATIKDVEQRIATIKNEFNSLDNKELHNIMMLRENIINLNKTHAPENAPAGVNYEEYLKEAEKNARDAYNTALKDYEKNRPVEAAEHFEKIADLNKLEDRKRAFINYYDQLNNPEKANAVLAEEQKALEELANQVEADAKRKEDEERKAAEADALQRELKNVPWTIYIG